jgi:hypothetical protein
MTKKIETRRPAANSEITRGIKCVVVQQSSVSQGRLHEQKIDCWAQWINISDVSAQPKYASTSTGFSCIAIWNSAGFLLKPQKTHMAYVKDTVYMLPIVWRLGNQQAPVSYMEHNRLSSQIEYVDMITSKSIHIYILAGSVLEKDQF